jgi:hypothetical protein
LCSYSNHCECYDNSDDGYEDIPTFDHFESLSVGATFLETTSKTVWLRSKLENSNRTSREGWLAPASLTECAPSVAVG